MEFERMLTKAAWIAGYRLLRYVYTNPPIPDGDCRPAADRPQARAR